jgi:hypothetical protein
MVDDLEKLLKNEDITRIRDLIGTLKSNKS